MNDDSKTLNLQYLFTPGTLNNMIFTHIKYNAGRRKIGLGGLIWFDGWVCVRLGGWVGGLFRSDNKTYSARLG